jgi:hypothetical protein
MRRTTTLHRRRLTTALLLAAISLAFGCAHSIKTERAGLAPLPPGAAKVRVATSAVHDTASTPALDYHDYASDLKRSLEKQARHQLSTNDDTELVLAEVSISARPPIITSVSSFGLAFFSFFIPPLAFVPESSTVPYTIDYAVDDRAGREVLRGKLQDSVKGSISGYYIGRIHAAKALLIEQGRFVAENAATLLINDLRSRNVQLASAAEHYRKNQDLTAREAIAMRDRQRERQRIRMAAARAAQPMQLVGMVGGQAFGTRMPASAPAMQTTSANRSALPIKRVAALMKPAIIGPRQESQDQILYQGMQSKLRETHQLVTEAETEAAVAKARLQTKDPGCTSEACHRAVLAITGAEQLFSLRIIREQAGAQLLVGARWSGQRASKAAYCDECGTGKLDIQVSELTSSLVAQMAPQPPPAAPAPMPGAMPAMALSQQSAAAGVASAVGDIAKQCLAKTAATQACSLAPGFAKIACRLAVQAKWSSVACPGM